MKTLLMILLSGALALAPSADENYHELGKQWKSFEAAQRSDKPQDALKALEAIKKEAFQKRMSWDYYDAAEQFVDVSCYRNWKLRDSLQARFAQEIQEYDRAVTTFFYKFKHGSDNLKPFVIGAEKELRGGRNIGFYHNAWLGMQYSEFIVNHIDNDYEFALWQLFGRDKSLDLLDKEVNGIKKDLLDYYRTPENGLEDFAKAHQGQVIALAARSRMLQSEFYKLNGKTGAVSEEFKALRSKCEAFEKERKAFKGEEKELADLIEDVKYLIDQLDSKSISASIDGDTLSLYLQNLAEASVSIKSGDKTVFSSKVKNPAGSYYLQDTVKCDLPAFDDGNYNVNVWNGDEKFESEYNKRTLSAILRRPSSGTAVFVCDSRSGKPLEKVNISILRKNKEIFRQEGVVLNGFTPLPSGAVKAIGEKNTVIVCDWRDSKGILHKSSELNSDWAGYSVDQIAKSTYAKVITDCAAFHKNDTVKFKAVFYSGNPTESYSVLNQTGSAEAVLLDPERKEVAKKILKINEFGSAAGEFEIPEGRRNGIYNIKVKIDGIVIGTAAIRVDDFVLPSFEVLFDEKQADYLPGQTICVNGRIKSYSGHKLASAKVSANVSGKEAEIKVQPDGSFCVQIPTSGKDSYQYFYVTVKVTDATGESIESGRSVNVTSYLNLLLNLENEADAECKVKDKNCRIVEGNLAKVKVSYKDITGLAASYILYKGEKALKEGSIEAPGTLELPLEGPSGLYSLKVKVLSKDGQYKEDAELMLLKIGSSDTGIKDSGIENVFLAIEGENPSVRFGSSEAPLWVLVDLVGANGKLLASDLVPTKKGEIHTIEYKYRKEFGRAVTIYLHYFRNNECYTYSHSFRYDSKVLDLPLDFERFEDKALPGSEYRFSLKTLPGTECAVTVFDKSTEAIQANRWASVSLSMPSDPRLNYCIVRGNERMSHYIVHQYRTKGAVLSTAVNSARIESVALDSVVAVEEESAVMEMKDMAAYGNGTEEPAAVREDFSTALAFLPFLRADENGKTEFSFRTSDKLSTFIVQAFVHDKGMRNAVIRKEMIVSLPVKVSLYEPQYLYSGDKYTIKANLSSNAEQALNGVCSIKVYNGKQRSSEALLFQKNCPVTIDAGGNASAEMTIDVPEAEELGLLVSFVPKNGEGSDAVFVSVPVKKPVQELTEAYSAVLLSGASREELIENLRSRFVNVSGSDAEVREISILDMVREAIPQTIDAEAKDLVSLSGNLMSALLAQSLGGAAGIDVASLEKKIMACKSEEGGFAWFEGMEPSPLLTAMLLQRLWFIGSRGLQTSLTEAAPEAVRYLDKQYFGEKERPFWRGGISMEQYLLIRSMYSYVPLEGVGAAALQKFRKEAKKYLTPRKERGLNGQLLAKTRRMLTLTLLSESPDGGFDAGLGSDRKLLRSRDADLTSLLQYAVEHPEGGIYFPNAVMPWRGLMESELSAHALLCELLSRSGYGNVADGLRIWMMIQKETQQWKSDPGYIEALASVLDGSKEALETKVIALSKDYCLPFEDIKSFGNGFTLGTVYLKNGQALAEGDTLLVGEKIEAVYNIWNAENRSFVRLSVPRPACLRPVDQLSGRTGYWGYQGYRNVLADRTEYWYESYPEEKTTVREVLYVTQEGLFQCPAATIESLYATHYRAATEALSIKSN